MNDVNEMPVIFCEAVRGDFDNYSTVMDREGFFKTDDIAQKTFDSFGNKMDTFAYGKELEAVKVPAMQMLSAPSMHERRMKYIQFIKELDKYIESGQPLERIKNLESLCRIERTQKLKGLKGADITPSVGDYRLVEFPDNCLVYADPPYRGSTQLYQKKAFDHESFDKWLGAVDFPIIVSEYTRPEGCVEIASKDVTTGLSASTNSTKRTEKLFIQDRFKPWYDEVMKE